MHKKQYQSQLDLNRIEETIRHFDCFGSVFRTSDSLLTVFDELKVPVEAENTEFRTLIAFVGSAWADMVQAVELEFDLPHGMEVFSNSKAVVEIASNRMENESHPYDPGFPPFVVARWYDIVAKLFYFSGDHYEASLYWDKARVLIEKRAITYIKADVLSSRLRNLKELIRITTSDTAVAAAIPELAKYLSNQSTNFNDEFRNLIVESLGRLPKKISEAIKEVTDIQDVSSEKLDRLREWIDDSGWKQKGELRGLANLYQNSDQFAQVRLISTAMRDDLRLVQSYHAEAGRVWLTTTELKKARDSNPEALSFKPDFQSRAAHLWKQVRDSEAWARGVIFARQHLARLDKEVYFVGATNDQKFWGLVSGIEELVNIIDAIQDRDEEMSGRRPAFEVRDIEQHGWTVKFALDMLEELESLYEQNPDLRNDWVAKLHALDERMLEECIQMIRSHRKVVKIATFKTSFASHYNRACKRVYRHFTDRISLNSESNRTISIRNALAWVEESTCRDLLDALAASNDGLTSASMAPNQEFNASTGGMQKADGKERQPSDLLLLCEVDREVLAENSEQRNQLEESLARFEDFASRNPHLPQEVKIDIFERSIEAAKKHNCYFVRFAERHDLAFDVFIFTPNGKVEFTTILKDANVREELQNSLHTLLTPKKVFGQYRDPLKSLADMIGKAIVAPLVKYVKKELHVFLIPTGFLWQIPMHIGTVDKEKFFQRNAVFVSGSLAALLNQDRISVLSRTLLNRSCAILGSYYSKEKTTELGKSVASHFRTCCNNIQVVAPWYVKGHRVNSETVRQVFLSKPEIIYYGCHGSNVENKLGRHPVLAFTNSKNGDKSFLTPYDIAIAPNLVGNVFTIFGACMSGQASVRDGGEVSGFFRASVAAGAGACLLTYWPITVRQVDSFLEKLANSLSQKNPAGEAFQATRNELPDWIDAACFVCFI